MMNFKKSVVVLAITQSLAAFGVTKVSCISETLHVAQAKLELDLLEVSEPNIVLTVGNNTTKYKANIVQYVETAPTRLAGATIVHSTLGEENYISLFGYYGNLSGTAQLGIHKKVTLFLTCKAK